MGWQWHRQHSYDDYNIKKIQIHKMHD
jgi:hypothetical protein